MASTINEVVLSLVLALLASPSSCNAHLLKECEISAIYQLGDSTSDTGNLMHDNPHSACSVLPYGAYYFGNATGRCSDGLLMIDYFALSAGVPFLDAYLNLKPHTQSHGVNFAVTGATALPVHILAEKNISSPVTNLSLSEQLDWMFTYINQSVCNSTNCYEKLMKSLFIVGEIGGNDYNFALFQGKPLEVVKAIAPDVVQAIKHAVRRVIGYGARQVVVPGHFPIGCFPSYLTVFQSNDSAAYDQFHCLRGLNNVSIYHNDLLQQALEELRKEHPNVSIVYGDYYTAFMRILQNAASLGFDPKWVQKSCCGMGGKYMFSLAKMCGAPEVPVCDNPFRSISWDGIHLTHKAYLQMARWLVDDIVSKLHCRP